MAKARKAVLHPNLDADSPPLGHWQIQACGQAVAHQGGRPRGMKPTNTMGSLTPARMKTPCGRPGKRPPRSSTKLKGLDDMQHDCENLGSLDLITTPAAMGMAMNSRVPGSWKQAHGVFHGC